MSRNNHFTNAVWFLLFILIVSVVLYAGQSFVRKINGNSAARFRLKSAKERGSQMKDNGPKNRLQYEKSPYLLQHADNPVDWYPWGDEAFKKAKEENKPIFLSIGYSTCHWCHVMAHESFEDPEVAELMNKTFINIKVDREERPDIDGIYMNVCQMMTGGGGWPLTIIMTPDKKPFFSGTYFPKESRYGRVGLIDLIRKTDSLWKNSREEVNNASEEILKILKKSSTASPGKEIDESFLKITYLQLKDRYDSKNGGFGKAPKFPTPHNLLFLLRFWKRTDNKQALEMVEKTLKAMKQGGIYDHVGHGFHRYSTDRNWTLPHFEKMLYDQALLAMAYTEAYQATGNQEYRKTAEEIFNYVLRDLTSPEGGFYSAEDADSEGVEGKFYIWKEDEIKSILGDKDADLFINVYNVKKAGNFRDEASMEMTGQNILHITKPLAETAKELKIPLPELESRLESSRKKLFEVREKRIRPHRDDKILTDWNGLMIAALSKASRAFNKPRYAEAARKAADFLLSKSRKSDGRLFHRYRDGEAGITGYLDDYAFFNWGLIELYEATFDIKYLQTALALNNEMIKHFQDTKNGGFFLSADDGENLLIRQREIYDGAIPSGNSIAMLTLLKIARITGNPDFEKMAANIGRTFHKDVAKTPMAHTMLMCAIDFAEGPSQEIVLVGNPGSGDTGKFLDVIYKGYLPNKVVIFKPGDESQEITKIAGYTTDQKSIDNKMTVYVCMNFSCKKPVTDVEELKKLLK